MLRPRISSFKRTQKMYRAGFFLFSFPTFLGPRSLTKPLPSFIRRQRRRPTSYPLRPLTRRQNGAAPCALKTGLEMQRSTAWFRARCRCTQQPAVYRIFLERMETRSSRQRILVGPLSSLLQYYHIRKPSVSAYHHAHISSRTTIRTYPSSSIPTGNRQENTCVATPIPRRCGLGTFHVRLALSSAGPIPSLPSSMESIYRSTMGTSVREVHRGDI